MMEAMGILQEECAEVIQVISKIRRFGIDDVRHTAPIKSNRNHLEEEIGDVLALIDILINEEIISNDAIQAAKTAKFEKLKKWSNITNIQDIRHK